jgi:hypothetical protein
VPGQGKRSLGYWQGFWLIKGGVVFCADKSFSGRSQTIYPSGLAAGYVGRSSMSAQLDGGMKDKLICIDQLIAQQAHQRGSATAFLSVAATAVPLNPTYREAEFDFYLADLNAKALIVEADSDCPAIAVAKSRNIPVIYLSVENGAVAGQFVLDTVPTMVPLSQRNICASAHNIAKVL